jgi:hypothetical protein
MAITRTATPNKILLGMGVFKINEVAIGLTRGGGQFTVEKEMREITADGDRGTYKDRVVQDSSRPKLKLSALEVISENLPKLYPALSVTADSPIEGSTKITGTGVIATTDYQTKVTWTGETKAGKQVIITLYNAICLENLDWTLADKDEVVAEVTYTGCYLEDSPANFEPWDVVYVN